MLRRTFLKIISVFFLPKEKENKDFVSGFSCTFVCYDCGMRHGCNNIKNCMRCGNHHFKVEEVCINNQLSYSVNHPSPKSNIAFGTRILVPEQDKLVVYIRGSDGYPTSWKF
jgi:hypothetical protein